MKKPEKHEKSEKPTENPAGEPEQTPAAPGPAEGSPKSQSGASEASQEPLVGLTMAEYTELQHKADQAEQKAKEYFEGWQRERADFSNYRRRIERENTQLQQNLTGQILKRYLVIVDDLDRALKSRPTQGDGAAWAEGVDLINRKLATLLDSEGVKPIPADGAQFDPQLHEAITHEDSPDHESGQVIEVVQKGYMIGDRVLRPALVRVAR